MLLNQEVKSPAATNLGLISSSAFRKKRLVLLYCNIGEKIFLRLFSYLFKPIMVCAAYLCLPPSLEIEDVHAIGPSTLIGVEIL